MDRRESTSTRRERPWAFSFMSRSMFCTKRLWWVQAFSHRLRMWA